MTQCSNEHATILETWMALVFAEEELMKYAWDLSSPLDLGKLPIDEQRAARIFLDGMAKVRMAIRMKATILEDVFSEAQMYFSDEAKKDNLHTVDVITAKSRQIVRDQLHSENYIIDYAADAPKWDRMLRNAKRREAVSEDTINRICSRIRIIKPKEGGKDGNY